MGHTLQLNSDMISLKVNLAGNFEIDKCLEAQNDQKKSKFITSEGRCQSELGASEYKHGQMSNRCDNI